MSVSGEPLLSIYNSRNYWSLLAYEPMTVYRPKSTIVEIIEAY